MTTGDRLTVIGIGLGVIITLANGTCSTNQRFGEFERRFTEAAEQRREAAEQFERRFTEAAEQRREAAEQFERRFTEAAEQRRDEHGQIIRRLERLEDLHLKPVAEAP